MTNQNGTEEVIDEKEGADVQDEAAEETATAEDGREVPGQEEDGAGEDQPNGEGAGEDEGQAEAAVDPAEEIAALKNQLKEMQAKLPKEEPKTVELTPEQKQKYEDQIGVPYKAIEFFVKMQEQTANHILETIEKKFAGPETERAIAEFAKDKQFTDAPRYSAGISEFFDKYNVKNRSDKANIEAAYFWAKGRAASGQVKKALNNDELNRKVIKKNQPVGGQAAGSKAGGKFKKSNNPAESQARRLSGMSDEEWGKRKAQGGRWNIA